MKKKKQETTIVVEKPKKKKKKHTKLVIFIIILILVVIALVKCNTGAETITTVDVTKATVGDITSTLDTSGTLASEMTQVYASPVSATIEEVNAEVGQAVATGDYLVTYNTASLEANYDTADLQAKAQSATNSDTLNQSTQNEQDKQAAEASIADANAQIDAVNAQIAALKAQITQNAIDSNNNSTALLEVESKIAANEAAKAEEKTSADDLKSWTDEKATLSAKAEELKNAATSLQSDLENKTSELADHQGDLAEAQTKESTAEAGIMTDNAKASLDYTSQVNALSVTSAEDSLSKAKAGVTAKFDGIVTAVDAISGSVAVEGQSLVTVASSTDIKVDFQVSKYNLEELAVGQDVTVTALDKEYQGTVSKISKIATETATTSTASTAMVSAEVHIENPDDKLVIGLDAKLSIALGSVKDALLVPITAVNTNKDGDFVYVVEDNTVVKKAVETGMYSNEQVEIKDGIKEDDMVISTVDSSIEEGTIVVTNLVEE